jgi:hypothetical protein
MYLFALVMIVLNAAAFGPSFVFHQSEPNRIRRAEPAMID